ncbi:MAG TPA: HEAT repeat domain-containing protein [Pyrinomonadaceae bacterium]|jgi:biotin carboxyl carrier protein|nr:HEAT repeat domain-containing protein [Pyrinomonadaceae bacterium]
MSDTQAHTGANGDGPARAEGDASKAGRRRTPWPLVVVALLFVIVPSLTWYLTWFGRGLTDEELTRYLSDSNPRHAQHALSQLAGRIEKGDAAASRWNAQVITLSQSQTPDLRMTAAWVMGLEHKSEDFRAALLRLLEDPEPIVRRNAALALVRFGDARSRPELRAMLRPVTLSARTEGTAQTALTVGTPVKRESLLLRYNVKPNLVEELRSPVPGRVEKAFVKEGDSWSVGAELFVISPDAEQVEDALLGLAYLGTAEDLPDVERYARGVEWMPEEMKTKAAQVAEAIKRRSQVGR